MDNEAKREERLGYKIMNNNQVDLEHPNQRIYESCEVCKHEDLCLEHDYLQVTVYSLIGAERL